MKKIGTTLHRTKNCGIVEIHGLACRNLLGVLRDIEPVLRAGVTWPPKVDHSGARQNCPYPFVTFTGVSTETYGQQFANLITENNLGELATLPSQKNWTNNRIQHWLWRPNYPNLWAFLDANPTEVKNALEE